MRSSNRYDRMRKLISWFNKKYNFKFERLANYRFGDNESKIVIEFAGEQTQETDKDFYVKERLLWDSKGFKFYLITFADFKDEKKRQKIITQILHDLVMKMKHDFIHRNDPPCDIFDDLI